MTGQRARGGRRTTDTNIPDRMHGTDIDRSNSLADLAAKVQAEHKAVTDALSKAVEHALQAGAYLTEAKEQVKHGQWLPWLKRCGVSSRTAQLYMQLHKHRDRIEKELRNSETAGDLTLNEAAAMCVLAGRFDRLVDFARRAQNLSSDELVNLTIKEGFMLVKRDRHGLFHGRSDEEKRDWLLFGLWIGNGAAYGFDQMAWAMRRPFQNVDEWTGPEGDKFRTFWLMQWPEKHKAAWRAYRDKMLKRFKTAADVEKEIERVRNTPKFLEWAAKHE